MSTDPLSLLGAITANGIRPPDSWVQDAGGVWGPAWNPPLSAADQQTVADLTTMGRFGVTLTLAEWQSIKGDAAALRQYLGVASPTAAQTASATKSIIRVLATIIRS